MKKDLKILLVNDDGIHAPGLERLAAMATRLGRVWVAAPGGQCSAMSQKLTIFSELEVQKQDYPVAVEGAYSIGGTPADCVKVALTYLMEEKPDIVFSGINNGFNTGFDICYSGTVGAAMEALLNGVPAIAFSSEHDRDYSVVEQYLPAIAKELLGQPQSLSEIWNVNFPCCAVEELRGILRDRKAAPISLYTNYYVPRSEAEGKTALYPMARVATLEQAPAGSDIHAVLQNYISIGKLRCVVF